MILLNTLKGLCIDTIMFVLILYVFMKIVQNMLLAAENDT